MGNSLEYIKKRIEEGSCYDMSMEEFRDMHEIPFKSCFPEGCEDYMVISTVKDGDRVFADLTYSPNAEFNYFITETCVCDGTLTFMTELAINIIERIWRLETCYAPAFYEVSEKELIVDDYAIHYEVGDFVANSHMVEPPDKSKPWMCDKFTMMLPVKFTLEKVRGLGSVRLEVKI